MGGRKDRQAWQRIVALLLSFAALADRAGTRPRPIRVVVLWLLRAVEQIAREFVIAVAEEGGIDASLDVPLYARDIADDAARLARSFTVLAELLADLTCNAMPPLRHGVTGCPVDHLVRMVWTLASQPAAPERQLPDTS